MCTMLKTLLLEGFLDLLSCLLLSLKPSQDDLVRAEFDPAIQGRWCFFLVFFFFCSGSNSESELKEEVPDSVDNLHVFVWV